MLSTYESDQLCENNFFSAFAWETSRNGNKYRRWKGFHIVVFRCRTGTFGWFATDRKRSRKNGPCSYENEDDAKVGVYRWWVGQQGERSTAAKRVIKRRPK